MDKATNLDLLLVFAALIVIAIGLTLAFTLTFKKRDSRTTVKAAAPQLSEPNSLPRIYKDLSTGYWQVRPRLPHQIGKPADDLFYEAQMWSKEQNRRIFNAKPAQQQRQEVWRKFTSRGEPIPVKWR